MKSKVIGYWATTILLALELLVGGEWDLTHRADVVQVVTHLGFWKLLALFPLLAPGLARLKEWTYAGIVFELSGALLSQVLSGSSNDLVFPLMLIALTVASWALRPQSRTLGTLFPGKPNA
jgi:DoxX-like protein